MWPLKEQRVGKDYYGGMAHWACVMSSNHLRHLSQAKQQERSPFTTVCLQQTMKSHMYRAFITGIEL